MECAANSFQPTEQQTQRESSSLRRETRLQGCLTSNSLREKVAMIADASSGIGEATALVLSEAGAKVGIVGRSRERLELLAQRIEARGGQVLVLVADVSIEAEVLSAIDELCFDFGRLDILINNAAMLEYSLLEAADTDTWQRIIENNLLGLMYATQAAIRVMKLQRSGHVINVSLMMECFTAPSVGVYAATRSGVIAFLEELRQEMSQYSIRVTVVKSGPVATELPNYILDPIKLKQVGQWFNSMTVLQPEDIAASILYALTQPVRVNVNEIFIRPTDIASIV